MDRLNDLLTRYDRREISRRDMLSALAFLGIGAAPGAGQAVAQGRTLNHVSLGVAELRHSVEFYDRLLRLPVRDRGADYCEYRVQDGFLGLYQRPDMRRGLDHVAVGVDGYDAKAMLEALRRDFPDSSAELLNGDQVYIADPDGARIQLCAIDYKR